ncbi:hypothetical protein DPMN_074738 [Dreissena polymorpha]|uniref:Uncharacterized protein n=1 Tax=Dreissena polymorpha TaxID=45954 RepID=A0A9D3YI96_DREPO|nr:hypothetical protein DPMN_074738 [Dreissena polymorpha]
MLSMLLRSGVCKREVTEKSSYLNRTGSVFYIGRHCEIFEDGYQTLDDAVCIVKKSSGNLLVSETLANSMELLAATDAQYKFLLADVGSPGSNSDFDIFNDFQLPQALERNTLGFPEPDSFPHDENAILLYE